MTKLREQFKRDMELKNFSPNTQQSYIRHVALFAKHYSKSSELPDTEEVKAYLYYLISERNMSKSYVNQEVIYKVLSRAASETLLEQALDSKYLGAQTCITALLHTLGQNLMFHPHIHCIVPSGGLSTDGIRWINSRKKFFIPVRVLSKKFREKFIAYLQSTYFNKELKFMGEIEELSKADVFLWFIQNLRQTDWVVYCKPPFKSAEYVLQYLGRYTHRVAISNNRIVSCEKGIVTCKWRL